MQIHALADASGKQQFRVGRPWQESASPHSDSPQDQSVSMQYNVQYLDGSKNVIGESSVDTAVISKFISDRNWPPGAVLVRVLTQNGRRVLSLTKPPGVRAVDA